MIIEKDGKQYKKCEYSKHEGNSLISVKCFGKNKQRKDNLAAYCRKCTSEYQKQLRRNDPTFSKESSRKYYLNNKESYDTRRHKWKETTEGRARNLLAQAKCRAKTQEVEFDLKYENIVIPKHCPVLGIPINFNTKGKNNKGNKDHSPSIDRIDPSKGYTEENIVIVSWRANRLKSDATQYEIKLLYEFYAKKASS